MQSARPWRYRTAIAVDESRSIVADPSKQHYTVAPESHYLAMQIRCEACQQLFWFSEREQQHWHEELRFWIDSVPRCCAPCRREARGEARELAYVTTPVDARAVRLPLLVLGAASLALTAARLAGELWGGPAWLFGRDAGGGGALVGIGWLIPVAGWWCGQRLARAGNHPRPRAARTLGVGLLGVAIVFAVAKLLLPVTLGTFAFVAATLPLLAVLAWRAWPELARTLLVFAALQRVPVLAITAVAVANGWGTHYERLAPGSPPMGDVARTLVLCTAQLCLWVPITLLAGGLAGVLAARRSHRRIDA